jgi:hypothetical protein
LGTYYYVGSYLHPVRRLELKDQAEEFFAVANFETVAVYDVGRTFTPRRSIRKRLLKAKKGRLFLKML